MTNKNIKITLPKNQLNLYGYKNKFNLFIELFKKKKIPNSLLFSGLKGSGKATFAYHLTNYLLSQKEDKKYLTNTNSIDDNNRSYRLLISELHPNFFLIDINSKDKDIKIDQVRSLIRFLNKSTYSLDLKIVMIDNAEYLNLNSSNALLKAVEEPGINTFFFIIHNSSSKILDTIKSRCVEFKFFLTESEKIDILKNLVTEYENKIKFNEIYDKCYFNTPGNILNYFSILNDADISIAKDNLSIISYLITKYKNDKNPQIITFLLQLIQKFYHELCLNNKNKLIYYLNNQSKIFKQIYYMKKFNLNENDVLVSINDILINETK